MKPRNFPARREARRIAADLRAASGPLYVYRDGRRELNDKHHYITADEVLATHDLTLARNVRTKKRRAHGQ